MWKILFLFTLITVTACNPDNSLDEESAVQNEHQTMEPNDADESKSSENGTSQNHLNSTGTKQESPSNYSYKVIYEEKTGWGYQIFDGSKMVINQMHIPAIQGIQGFSSQKKAEKTANYVVEQIEKGNFPPTLSKEILDSLNVL